MSDEPRNASGQTEKEFAEQTLRMFSTPPKPPLYARIIGTALAWWWKKHDGNE
jgi:hypothetical protein